MGWDWFERGYLGGGSCSMIYQDVGVGRCGMSTSILVPFVIDVYMHVNMLSQVDRKDRAQDW